MKCSYFQKYRPALLLISAAVIVVCQAYRLILLENHTMIWELIFANIVYLYCVMLAFLSDFHTRPTKIFRLVVPLLMVLETGWCVYYYTFVATNQTIITINGRTLGVNTVERNAYCQILFLLIAQLFSLIADHHHTKFFLIPRRCERDEIFSKIF